MQHHGWRYDYRARRVRPEDRLGPLPLPLGALAARLAEAGWFDAEPDQAIVNEYLPGQGIAPHVDCEPCFGETIATTSLLGACTMRFERVSDGARREIRLLPGSLLVLAGEARHAWRHGIPARRSDVVEGRRVPRLRRISLTFRTVREVAGAASGR